MIGGEVEADSIGGVFDHRNSGTISLLNIFVYVNVGAYPDFVFLGDQPINEVNELITSDRSPTGTTIDMMVNDMVPIASIDSLLGVVLHFTS